MADPVASAANTKMYLQLNAFNTISITLVAVFWVILIGAGYAAWKNYRANTAEA